MGGRAGGGAGSGRGGGSRNGSGKFILRITSKDTGKSQDLRFPSNEARWKYVKSNPILAKMNATITEVNPKSKK